MAGVEKLHWNVKYYDCNRSKIDDYDVLAWFTKVIKTMKKKYTDKATFAKALDSEMMYHFWCKSEWELQIKKVDDTIFLYPWVGCRDMEGTKINVTTDSTFDWFDFYKQLGEHRRADDYGIKFDVYSQLRYRWNEFVDYCWNTRLKYERIRKSNLQ